MAKAWSNLAAKINSKDVARTKMRTDQAVAMRHHFEKQMSPQQVATGKKRAAELEAQVAAKLKNIDQ